MTAIVLIACLVGLVWGTIALMRGSLHVGCVAFVVVAACFGHQFLTFELGPLPLTFDRLVLGLLLAAFVVQWRLGNTEPKPLDTADKLILALLGYLAISTFSHDFHANPAIAKQVSPVWRLIAGYVIPSLIYWMARQSKIREAELSWVHTILIAFGIYLSLTGVLEIAQQWSFVFPAQIADPAAGIHFGRARGPMLTSVTFGMFVAICLWTAWVALPRFGRFGQLVLCALVPLFVSAIYFSYTRSVWGGAALSLVTVTGLTLRGAIRKLVLASMLMAGLFVAVTSFDSLMDIERESPAGESRDSAKMRASFTYVSWQMFLDQPLLGCGFGHFQEAKWPYLSDRSTNLNLESIRGFAHHNTLLSLLTETGIPGLALFLGILACWTRDAWLLWRDPQTPEWARRQAVLLLAALGVYAWQLLFHELSYTPLDNSLVFLLAGMTTGLRVGVDASSAGRTVAGRSIGFDRRDLLSPASPHLT